MALFDVCSSEWKPAVDLAAVDCAAEENRKVCTGFGIRAYPTIKVLYSILSVYTGPTLTLIYPVKQMSWDRCDYCVYYLLLQTLKTSKVLEQVLSLHFFTVNYSNNFLNNSPKRLKDLKDITLAL